MKNDKILNVNLIVIYSKDVTASEDFYKKVLRKEPVAQFDGFSLFDFMPGMQLGIQSESDILPKANGQTGGFELCISDVTNKDVDDLCQIWKKEGFNFVLEPQQLEFGYTAVIVDPDGHRIRVCATDTSNVEAKTK